MTSRMLATAPSRRNRMDIAALIRTEFFPGRHRTCTGRMRALFFHVAPSTFKCSEIKMDPYPDPFDLLPIKLPVR
jgi:hypothetical protein